MTGDIDQNVVPEADHGSTLTLAIEHSAIKAFAQPATVVEEARQWSQFVGIVGEDPEAVESTVGQYGLHQDFRLDVMDTQSVLSRLKWEADTDRYVYIGTDDQARALAEYVNWEFLTVQEAAEAADWKLSSERSFFRRLTSVLSW